MFCGPKIHTPVWWTPGKASRVAGSCEAAAEQINSRPSPFVVSGLRALERDTNREPPMERAPGKRDYGTRGGPCVDSCRWRGRFCGPSGGAADLVVGGTSIVGRQASAEPLALDTRAL